MRLDSSPRRFARLASRSYHGPRMPLTRIVLVAAIALFLIYLVIQVRPRAQRRRELEKSIKSARARAHEAKEPEERARALGDAGEAAARARRFVAAAGFFSRAMRHDPRSVDAIRRTADGLAKRPREAEKLLHRRLAALSAGGGDRDETAGARAELAGSLAAIYEGPLADPRKALVMRRLEHLERDRVKD